MNGGRNVFFVFSGFCYLLGYVEHASLAKQLFGTGSPNDASQSVQPGRRPLALMVGCCCVVVVVDVVVVLLLMLFCCSHIDSSPQSS